MSNQKENTDQSKKSKRRIIRLGIAAAGIFGLYLIGRNLSRLSKAQDKVAVTFSMKKERVDFITGLTLKIIYNIKNPTAAEMQITPPLIKLYIENKELAIASLQAVEIPKAIRTKDGKIQVNPYSETGQISTLITIPPSKFLSQIKIILERLASDDPKNRIDIKAIVQCDIFSRYAPRISYESTSITKI